jgi:hypothetical protein
VATSYQLVPNEIDASFVGAVSAVGAVAGGFWAYLLGYSLDDIAAQGAFGALAFGFAATAIWMLGLLGVDLLE